MQTRPSYLFPSCFNSYLTFNSINSHTELYVYTLALCLITIKFRGFKTTQNILFCGCKQSRHCLPQRIHTLVFFGMLRVSKVLVLSITDNSLGKCGQFFITITKPKTDQIGKSSTFPIKFYKTPSTA